MTSPTSFSRAGESKEADAPERPSWAETAEPTVSPSETIFRRSPHLDANFSFNAPRPAASTPLRRSPSSGATVRTDPFFAPSDGAPSNSLNDSSEEAVTFQRPFWAETAEPLVSPSESIFRRSPHPAADFSVDALRPAASTPLRRFSFSDATVRTGRVFAPSDGAQAKSLKDRTEGAVTLQRPFRAEAAGPFATPSDPLFERQPSAAASFSFDAPRPVPTPPSRRSLVEAEPANPFSAPSFGPRSIPFSGRNELAPQLFPVATTPRFSSAGATPEASSVFAPSAGAPSGVTKPAFRSSKGRELFDDPFAGRTSTGFGLSAKTTPKLYRIVRRRRKAGVRRKTARRILFVQAARSRQGLAQR